MDEFWAFVRKKEKHATMAEKLEEGLGDRWIHIAMDAVSRLIVAWNVERRTQKATDQLIADVAARLEDPLDALYTSDQHGPYKVAIDRRKQGEEAERQQSAEAATVPAHQTKPGMVLATVKKTYRQGRAVQVERRLEIGTAEDLQQRLDESPVSYKINTSFIERLNNTLRQDGRRVTRKSMGFSKEPDLLEAQIVLQIAHYNLVRLHRGLTTTVKHADGSTKKVRRTPAMEAGLTPSRWSLLDLLAFKVSPLDTTPGVAARAA